MRVRVLPFVGALVLFLLVPSPVKAASAGPNSPSAASQDGSIGLYDWFPLGSLGASDDAYSVIDLTVPSTQSHYLVGTQFGFSIPTSATITGIVAEVERHRDSGGGAMSDYAIRLVKGGVIGTTDRSDVAIWPTTDGYATYGGSGDVWGTTWTPADINAADFGFALSVQSGPGGFGLASVDHMRITVYYTLPDSPNSAGGGLPWNVLRQSNDARVSLPLQAKAHGVLTISMFDDLNADGIRQALEGDAFGDENVTVTGSAYNGTAVTVKANLDRTGIARVSVPPSGSGGYTVTVLSGTSLGHRMITTSGSSIIHVNEGEKAAVAIGVRRSDLLRHAPCLWIDETSDSVGDTDAETLLGRLRNAAGRSVVSAVADRMLMIRRDFLRLIVATQCLEMSGDPLLPTLVDAPAPESPDAHLLKVFAANSIAVWRPTAKGMAADLESPVSRREAVMMAAAAMDIPSARIASGGALAADLPSTDAATGAFLSLRSLGVLPESMQSVFGANQGLLRAEAAELAARASLRAGRISLSLDPRASIREQKPLDVLPPIRHPECLLQSSDRLVTATFSDEAPGGDLDDALDALLPIGTRNADGRILWLLPGTHRVTEFGVRVGRNRLAADQPVNLLETVRAMLVLSCLPPEPATGTGWVARPHDAGTLESWVSRDRVSGLSRDGSLASRIIYRAQDHRREYNLSLFSYAPDLLRRPPRSVRSDVSVHDASLLLASTILGIAVQQKTITPEQASRMAGRLAVDMRRRIVGPDTISRGADADGVKTLFTRRMLLRAIDDVLRTMDRSYHSPLHSLGERWWDRLQ